jgi:hypothetical protein
MVRDRHPIPRQVAQRLDPGGPERAQDLLVEEGGVEGIGVKDVIGEMLEGASGSGGRGGGVGGGGVGGEVTRGGK